MFSTKLLDKNNNNMVMHGFKEKHKVNWVNRFRIYCLISRVSGNAFIDDSRHLWTHCPVFFPLSWEERRAMWHFDLSKEYEMFDLFKEYVCICSLILN